MFADPYKNPYHFVVEFPRHSEEGSVHRSDVLINFIDGNPNQVNADVNGKRINLRGDLNLARSVLHLTVNGKGIATQLASKKPGEFTLIYKGSPFKMKVMPSLANNMLKFMKEKPKLDMSSVVIAPMPGAIKNVAAKEGMMVTEGQELCVMEAMKMQNSLVAGKTGKVKKVNCKPGDTVDEGFVLVELE